MILINKSRGIIDGKKIGVIYGGGVGNSVLGDR